MTGKRLTAKQYRELAEKLAETLRQVEYYSDYRNHACPWCHYFDPASGGSGFYIDPQKSAVSGFGHHPDCPRKSALAAYDQLAAGPQEPTE